MSLFQPSHLLRFLESIGHKAPSKRLSQNFLIDGNILKKIIAAAHLTSQDVVLEIGPGPGALTEALLATGATVIAIEKDPLFAQALTRLQTANHSLHVFESDILAIPLEKVLKTHGASHKKVKVISNLPYHLTSAIFGKILPLGELIETVIVMVQKEVADRIVASAGSKNYSSFSVFTQFYSHPKLLFQVSPHCFYPKPKVTSAVVECKLHPASENVDPSVFFAFIKEIFSARRKMLTTSLKKKCSAEKIQKILHSLGYDHRVRPEMLSLESLLILFQQIQSSACT